ncbi:hypothetical protein N431DRAFT_508956, partial [Stipitochalara longipes BDJ]
VAQRATFYHFPRLPADLRLQIWELTLPPRYIQIIARYTCTAESEKWHEIVEASRFGHFLQMAENASITSLSFTSVIENNSRLPVAARVHCDSRQLILPLYPLLFAEEFTRKTSNVELEFNAWALSMRTMPWACTALKLQYVPEINGHEVKRAQFRDGYDRHNPCMKGARVNAKLDTIFFPDELCMEYHPLALLYSFGELEHKAKTRHLAVYLHIWRSLLTGQAEQDG